ncbi:MAG: hypothetical protein FWG32_06355 [Oscillospiraceae bacterium]|nr:hypothetical protein [Oscillospiraceae bacterium]
MSYAKIAEITKDSRDEYLKSRIRAYRNNYDHIHAGEFEDFGNMPLYRKLPNPVGFAPGADVFPENTKITIRTLEGDVDTITTGDVYLMIGIRGEVYPIKKERFDLSYTVPGGPYRTKAEYTPAVINRFTGEKKVILPYAKTCIPRENKLVRARVLEKDTKVFTQWDTERYYHGGPGDFLAADEGGYSDCYIVRRDIFRESYELCGNV